MDIAIDIGNTNVTVGLKKGQIWLDMWRFVTTLEEPVAFYKMRMLDQILEASMIKEEIEQVCISSVVPDLNSYMITVVEEVFEMDPYLITTSSYGGMHLDIDHPDQLGTDLYANAVAAYKKFGESSLIVDFGTALTFTSVDDDCVLKGVAIAPGLKTALSALSGNTAQLPEVSLLVPDSPIGKNTSEAIRAGILHGYVGLVKHMLEITKVELGDSPKVIATGGLSKTLPLLKDEFDAIDEKLTLNGIVEIGRHIVQSQ
ncbi:MAG: type III pantothenate kinase [Bacteroidia bacterium]|nr:type III pantothenate kinase [Bacteroidia bacterium]